MVVRWLLSANPIEGAQRGNKQMKLESANSTLDRSRSRSVHPKSQNSRQSAPRHPRRPAEECPNPRTCRATPSPTSFRISSTRSNLKPRYRNRICKNIKILLSMMSRSHSPKSSSGSFRAGSSGGWPGSRLSLPGWSSTARSSKSS